jgi:hypothetical protein
VRAPEGARFTPRDEPKALIHPFIGAVSRGHRTNGPLRQYLPRTTNMQALTQGQLDTIAAELNGRPRQTLG